MMRIYVRFRQVVLVSVLLAVQTGVAGEVRRTNNRSPVYYVAEEDVGFAMNYTGYTYTNEARTAST